MAALLPRSTFSTHSLRRTEKFATWRDSISVLYQSSLIDGDEYEDFNAMTDGFLLGEISQIRCASDRQNFSRSRKAIDRDGIDHYMIQIFTQGRCHARTPHGDLVVEPGDICVFDNAQELDSTNERFDLMALFVPRSLLAPHINQADSRHLTCIKSDDPYARLVRAHVFALFQTASRMTVDQGNLIVDPTVSLLGATLNGNPCENEGGEAAVRLAITTTIKQHIDTCLGNPEFNADSICDAFGISRTRLYKLFQYTDGVASYIRNRRLSFALGLLSDPRHRHRKIIDIALTVGFGSEVSFIRAFRRRYGLTPSEVRNEGSPAQIESLAGADDEIFGDRGWVNWVRTI